MIRAGYADEGDLTPRMVAVLALTARGFTAREAGVELRVSTATVRVELSATYARLGARNAPHAVSIARDRGELA